MLFKSRNEGIAPMILILALDEIGVHSFTLQLIYQGTRAPSGHSIERVLEGSASRCGREGERGPLPLSVTERWISSSYNNAAKVPVQ
jgi:hypothetical protein